LDGKPNSTKDISFDRFVLDVLGENQPPYARIGSQRRFLTGKDGSVGATHMFQFEQMSGYVQFLERRLIRRIDLRRENVSPQMEIGLSPRVEEQLLNAWADEFELWEKTGQASDT